MAMKKAAPKKSGASDKAKKAQAARMTAQAKSLKPSRSTNDLAGSPAAGMWSKSGARVFGAPGRTDQRGVDQIKRKREKLIENQRTYLTNKAKVAKGKK